MASVAVRLLTPRIPLMLKTSIFHMLSLSPESAKWDLKTELIVNLVRSIIGESTSSITRQQRFSTKDPGVKGPMWISTTTIPVPLEVDVQERLLQTIRDLNDTGNETYNTPDLRPLEAEWTGYRAGVGKNEPPPASMSEADKYNNLMKEVASDVTILYFHGGALYLMDPASHRLPTSNLAKNTKGRVLSVRYRLAPQNPFPAAILDALVAYMSLLYPPEGSFHAPVKPEHIVFSGDSAGGNISLALLLFILHVQHSGSQTVKFNGKEVQIPLPGGVAAISPWCDVTQVMPSLRKNHHYDYLPVSHRATLHEGDGPPPKEPLTPAPCEIWPSDPPRANLYCEGTSLCHPLVSPLAAPARLWEGAPPMYASIGEEMLADEVKKTFARCREGSQRPVRLEQYEAMPHVFGAFMPSLPQSKRYSESIADWISRVVAGDTQIPDGAVFIEAKSLEESNVSWDSLIDITDEQVKQWMSEERERRLKVFAEVEEPAMKAELEKRKASKL